MASGALAHDISATQHQFVVNIRFQFEDEIVRLNREYRGPDGTTSLVVVRGCEGTTATSHPEGTELVELPALVTPETGELFEHLYVPPPGQVWTWRQLRRAPA